MLGILLYFAGVLCIRIRAEILRRDRLAAWVAAVL